MGAEEIKASEVPTLAPAQATAPELDSPAIGPHEEEEVAAVPSTPADMAEEQQPPVVDAVTISTEPEAAASGLIDTQLPPPPVQTSIPSVTVKNLSTSPKPPGGELLSFTDGERP